MRLHNATATCLPHFIITFDIGDVIEHKSPLGFQVPGGRSFSLGQPLRISLLVLCCIDKYLMSPDRYAPRSPSPLVSHPCHKRLRKVLPLYSTTVRSSLEAARQVRMGWMIYSEPEKQGLIDEKMSPEIPCQVRKGCWTSRAVTIFVPRAARKLQKHESLSSKASRNL